jgi:hypothetical protein
VAPVILEVSCCSIFMFHIHLTLVLVGSEVLIMVSMKRAVFWVVVPSSLIDCTALQPRRQSLLSVAKVTATHLFSSVDFTSV